MKYHKQKEYTLLQYIPTLIQKLHLLSLQTNDIIIINILLSQIILNMVK